MRILIQGIRSRTVWMIDIPENPYLHINRLFPQFNRLRSIKQYGTGMQYVGGSGDVISLQDHDRANHSYQVALSAERMGRALGLSNREIHILIYGGLLHDVATPGLGDITKLFFGIKSEETIFEPYIRASADYINSTGRIPGIDVNQIESYLRDAHDMSLEDIHRTIVGKGSIGEVLDIADRFTYTLEDTRMYFGHVYRDMIIRASRTPEIQAEMDQEALVNQTSGIAY